MLYLGSDELLRVLYLGTLHIYVLYQNYNVYNKVIGLWKTTSTAQILQKNGMF